MPAQNTRCPDPNGRLPNGGVARWRPSFSLWRCGPWLCPRHPCISCERVVRRRRPTPLPTPRQRNQPVRRARPPSPRPPSCWPTPRRGSPRRVRALEGSAVASAASTACSAAAIATSAASLPRRATGRGLLGGPPVLQGIGRRAKINALIHPSSCLSGAPHVLHPAASINSTGGWRQPRRSEPWSQRALIRGRRGGSRRVAMRTAASRAGGAISRSVEVHELPTSAVGGRVVQRASAQRRRRSRPGAALVRCRPEPRRPTSHPSAQAIRSGRVREGTPARPSPARGSRGARWRRAPAATRVPDRRDLAPGRPDRFAPGTPRPGWSQRWWHAR